MVILLVLIINSGVQVLYPSELGSAPFSIRNCSLSEVILIMLSNRLTTVNPRVISAYETRIEEMENCKLLLLEKTQNAGQPVHSFRQMFELSM